MYIPSINDYLSIKKKISLIGFDLKERTLKSRVGGEIGRFKEENKIKN